MTLLERYIRHVHNSKYSMLRSSCLCKAYCIVKAAQKLNHEAKLVICISRPEHSALFGWSLHTLHFYALIDGKKVDVAFDPELEKIRMRNEDVEMTKGIIIPWV